MLPTPNSLEEIAANNGKGSTKSLVVHDNEPVKVVVEGTQKETRMEDNLKEEGVTKVSGAITNDVMEEVRKLREEIKLLREEKEQFAQAQVKKESGLQAVKVR